MTEQPAPYKEVTEEQRQRIVRECVKCLAPVLTLSYPGNWGTRPLMEEAGVAFIRLTDGSGVRTMTYRVHDCSGERPVDPETGEVMLSAYEARRVLQEQSLSRVCPKCRAYIGEPCINMSKTKGPSVPTAWPHEERLEP